jgi:hypothetical protein
MIGLGALVTRAQVSCAGVSFTTSRVMMLEPSWKSVREERVAILALCVLCICIS